MGRDLAYVIRSLWRTPIFVVGVVFTFALAIGTNATMFGLVSRLMLSPPPGLRDPQQLYRILLRVDQGTPQSFLTSTTSYPVFETLSADSDAFGAVAASRVDSLSVGRSPDVARAAALGVTGNWFKALGALPFRGRFLTTADNDGAGTDLVVVSHEYWRNALGSDDNAVGREIILDDRPFTIVGIAAAQFNGLETGRIDFFIPLSAMLTQQTEWRTNTGMNIVELLARARLGASVSQMSQHATRYLATLPGERMRATTIELHSIIPGRTELSSPQARVTTWLAGVSLIVLVIAAVNIGTLFCLRAAGRRREVSIRIALGATAARIARQLITESLLLSLAGGAMGLMLSLWFSRLLHALLLPEFVERQPLADYRVLLASVALTVGVGIGTGLAPLVLLRRHDLRLAMHDGGANGTSRLGMPKMFVGVQVAICTVLAVGALLFARSLQRVENQDLGFSTSELLFAQVELRGYAPAVERDAAYLESVERLRILPGVTAVSPTQGIPFGPHHIPPISISGVDLSPDAGVQAPIMYAATPAYLDMMHIQLVRGRLFTDDDRRTTPLVMLVNEAMAQTVWPGVSPLGQCVRVGFSSFPPSEEGNPADGSPCREVVGVVRNSRARSLRPERNEDRLMQYYVPFEQAPAAGMQDQPQVMGMLIRINESTDDAVHRVLQGIQAAANRPAFVNVRKYQELIDPQLRSWRLGASLFSIFALLAVSIAAVGLYAIMSFLSAQRTREMGIRLALGSSRGRIGLLVLRDAIRLVAVGFGGGVLLAMAMSPVIAPMLFQVKPWDLPSIALTAMVLAITGVLAAFVPAWKASNVNPVQALASDP